MKPSHARITMLGLLLLYFFLATLWLTTAPVIHSDEAWIASVSKQFAYTGVLGTTVFQGLNGMERKYYEFMPLYSLVQAPILRAAGTELFSIRFVSVAIGALLLTFTFRIGVRVRDARAGLIAVVLLLFARMLAPDYQLASGILFLDVSRLGRYDILAAALSLAAFWAFVQPRAPTLRKFFIVGPLTGLAGLAHLYALVFVPLFFLATLWERRSWKMMLAMFIGIALAWLPYLAYIASDLPTFRAQIGSYGGRFEVFDLSWYLNNLLQEPRRYRLFDNGVFRRVWENPGVWLVLFGGAFGWTGLLLRLRQLNRAQRVLFLSIPAVVLMFALAIGYKLSNYLILLEPLLALVVAWGILELYDRGFSIVPRRYVRLAVILLLLFTWGEGLFRLTGYYARASQAPSFESIASVLQQAVPAGANVVGNHTFWLALQDTNFRSTRVLFNRTDPELSNAIPPAQFFDSFAPQVMLLDDDTRNYLHFGDRWGLESAAQNYRTAHGLEKRLSPVFPGYGAIEIYTNLPARLGTPVVQP